jgi:pimeloyl-ACP methyl ester carboxylesterase
MSKFLNNGVQLHYEVHGTGAPVLLLHGIVASFERNYAMFGWVESLTQRGLQVIGLDFRGHGHSDQPTRADAYGVENLASDVMALLDHLQLKQAMLVGYSLGTAIALHLLHTYPARFTRGVLVATGDGLLGFPPYDFAQLMPQLATVLARPTYPADLPRHTAAYWNFAQAGGEGQAAAALAMAQATYPPLSLEDAADLQTPVLVVSGERDPVLGQGPRLAAQLGQGHYLEIPGGNHFSLAADPSVQAQVADFLKGHAHVGSQ